MPQPIKNKNKKYIIKKDDIKKNKPNTSKLEYYFIKNFLNVLKLRYIHQWKSSIGKVYDFYLPELKILIEIDGDYWHLNPNIYKTPINEIQEKNVINDKIKNEWALLNGIVLLRFWESDIYFNRSKIIKILKSKIMIK
jgi:very-short-patch-repair endonuclease